MYRIAIALLTAAALLVAQSPLQSPATGLPSSTGPFEFKFRETFANGAEYVGLRGAPSVATSFFLELPATPGTSGNCLKVGGLSGGIQAITTAACDALWEVWTAADSVISLRTTTVARGIQVPYVRLSDFGTGSDANGAWKLRGTSTATDSTMSIIDSANVQVLKFNAVVGSVSTYEAVLNSSLLPPIDDQMTVGKAGTRFHEMHVNTMYMDACVGAGCGVGGSYWLRTGTILSPGTSGDSVEVIPAGGGPGITYIKARKIEVADQTGVTVWDIQSTANGASSNFFIRNNAGATVLNLIAVQASVAINEATIAMHWLPASTNTFKLGNSTHVWNTAHIKDLTLTGTCTGCPASDWTRNSGSGYLYPTVLTDKVGVGTATPGTALDVVGVARASVGMEALPVGGPPGVTYMRASKFEIRDATGTTVWDQQATANGLSSSTWWRNNGGTTVFTLTSVAGGVSVNEASMNLHFIPAGSWNIGKPGTPWQITYTNEVNANLFSGQTGSKINLSASIVPTVATTYNLGDAAHQFGVVYSSEFRGSNLFISAMAPPSGPQILIYSDLVPDATNTRKLGDPTDRWASVNGVGGDFSGTVLAGILGSSGTRVSKLWVTDIDCSGVCPGAGYLSDNGVTVSVTNTARNFGVGTNATAYKMEVVGSLKSTSLETSGNHIFSADMAYSIGTLSGSRPIAVYAGQLVAMYAGTSFTGAGMSSTAVAVANSGGVLTGLWTTSSGALWASGGFSAGPFPGTLGINFGPTASGCRWTLGLLTTGCAGLSAL